MRSGKRRQQGQSIVEYSLILAFVGLAIIAGIGYLQGKTSQAFQVQSEALGAPTFALGGGTAAAYSYPTSAADCSNEGWRTFYTPAGAFKNQGDCQSWVSTNGGNAPASTFTPIATNTAVPPTATASNTAIATSTATATRTPTATATNTAIATATATNTATATATATRTPTPLPPTATRTPSPGCFYINFQGTDYYGCETTSNSQTPPPGWNNCEKQYVYGRWYWACPMKDND